MIRASDLASAALWTRPSITSTAGASARDATGWFDTSAAASEATVIRADPNPASRGLSVEQHAERVLAHLRDEGDARA
jgi:hypothetical protein